MFFNKNRLVKDDLKGSAKLMYQDVSKDAWDQTNLTKENLDFTVNSIRYIDLYMKKLMTTDAELLNKHYDNFVGRIGAYIGEVIKRNIELDFHWYEFDSVCNHSSNLYEITRNKKGWTLLYSKKNDQVIMPLLVVAEFFEGDSTYPGLLGYVEEMIRQNS
jgi:transposase